MKWLLILYMGTTYDSTLTTMPKEYPSHQQCQYAGNVWKNVGPRYVGFACVPAPCPEHVNFKECNPEK